MTRLAEALLDWYARERRDLPWRRTRDPYAIWVAEIMLQQTQVETVLPYYRRFLARFPSVEALAEAELEEVLRVWEGMGYYGRARRLHQAAQRVAVEGFPGDEAGWRGLPGVGAYTAAAIASIAFGRDVLSLDGNARRVFARWFAVLQPDDGRLIAQATEHLPPGRPGDFNQAVMDLGSALCRPRQPRCLLCPVQEHCRAHRQGLAGEIPRPRPRAEVPDQDLWAAIVVRDGRLLLGRRPLDGLLGGLWEFPTQPGRPEPATQPGRPEPATRPGCPEPAPLVTVEHAYSHLRTTTRAYRVAEADLGGYEASAWVAQQDLAAYPMTKVARRIAEALPEYG